MAGNIGIAVGIDAKARGELVENVGESREIGLGSLRGHVDVVCRLRPSPSLRRGPLITT